MHYRVINTVTILFVPYLLLLQSCKKGPTSGVAAISRADKILPIVDAEVRFYGADFVDNLDKFMRGLTNEVRSKIRADINLKLSEAEKELKTFEATKESVIERAKKEAISRISRERSKAQASIDNLQNEINLSTPLITKLQKSLSQFWDREEALTIKATAIRENANKLSDELITQINAIIVSEQMPVPLLKPKTLSESPRVHRSLLAILLTYESSSSETRYQGAPKDFARLFGTAEWLGVNVSRRNRNAFVVEVKEASPVMSDFDEVLLIERIPSVLENSKVADRIRSASKILFNYAGELQAFEREIRANTKMLFQNFQIFVNAENQTIESVLNLLRRREQLLVMVEEAKNKLSRFDQGSELFKGVTNSLVEEALMNFDREATRFEVKVSTFKRQAMRLEGYSDSSMSGLEIQQEELTLKAIEEFLNAQKISSTRTGSDGMFNIHPEAQYISAFARLGEPKEEFFWLQKINFEDTTLILTNSNITRSSQSGALLGVIDCHFEK